jgi:hypothetical protein
MDVGFARTMSPCFLKGPFYGINGNDQVAPVREQACHDPDRTTDVECRRIMMVRKSIERGSIFS